jgi:3-(3-hydroxy-phenyl)propionate hydroxylase
MPHDCDVLVVGLGPVGAALCALLAREGVSAIAVERETDIYPLPRAAHFDHEIMRLFQKLGIAAEMQPASQPAAA